MKLFSRIFLTSVLLLSSVQLFSAAADDFFKSAVSDTPSQMPAGSVEWGGLIPTKIHEGASVEEEEAFLGEQEEPVAASSEGSSPVKYLQDMIDFYDEEEKQGVTLLDEVNAVRQLGKEIIPILQSGNDQLAAQKLEELAALFDDLVQYDKDFGRHADFYREEAKKLASKESGASEEAAPAATRAGVAVTADDKASARSFFNRINQSKAFRGNVRSNKNGLLDQLNALAAKGLKDAVSAQALLKKMN